MTVIRLATFACLLVAATHAAAFDRVGVVLLHGKTGMPSQFTGIANFFDEIGYAVEAPEMCWSVRRIYDRPLDACFEEVDEAVATLRNDGFDGIVVGGHSLGGLAALAYAARHPDLAGVIALAPDGEPTDFNGYATVAASVNRARHMVADGRGDEPAAFTDRVLGTEFRVEATARAFLSFLGGESPLQPESIMPDLQPPLLWVAGTRDSGQRNAEALFGLAPDDPLSQFIRVDANHLGTPGAAVNYILDWLDLLEGN